SYLDNSFPAYMGQDPSSINYQRMVSEDSVRYSAKTIANAWRLVTVSLKYSKLPVPEVALPRIVRKEKEFLDFDQIKTFISAARGDECEIYMLLALHSLRLSELLALNAGSFRGDVIHVRGAKIRSKDGMELRDLNKTDLSRRDVPIMIPRLKELIPQTSFPLVHSCGMINDHIEKICTKNNPPKCTCHSLRHSFASLAYHLRWTEKSTMQLGGWSTTDVVHEVYTHLSSKDLNNDVQKMIDFYTST
ncbi:MAG: hypothetical protein J6Z35_11990, partial [Lachnospiraceae bacterium]|nr:hypothetical protein [Lachnospiraceae bacterium]